jgi:hypothetical protein
MNQALYAHMNNKRKMKKKKRHGLGPTALTHSAGVTGLSEHPTA